MKTRKEIEKGCDKDLGWCSDLLLRNACCGEETELGVEYCPTCQALFQQSKEFIETIDKWWKSIDIIHDAIKDNNKVVTPEEFEELKSSIIGSEEKS